MTKIIIKKVRDGSFTSGNGEEINYFWYKALRRSDDVTLEFGSSNEYKINDEIEIELEKIEISGGKYRYKEPSKTE